MEVVGISCGWGGGKGARAVAVCRRAVEITYGVHPTVEYSVRHMEMEYGILIQFSQTYSFERAQ